METLLGLNRRIADAFVPLLVRTPLRPNHVTTLSLVSGLFAAWLLSLGSRKWMLAGALALQFSFILDNCDGTLARLKSMQSALGMWYDYAADLAVELALWMGLAAGAIAQGVSPSVTGILAVLAVAGSIVNFIRVVFQRARPRSDSAPQNPAAAVMERLSDDADATLFAWGMALIGYSGWFLFGGCLYVNALWIYSTASRNRTNVRL